MALQPTQNSHSLVSSQAGSSGLPRPAALDQSRDFKTSAYPIKMDPLSRPAMHRPVVQVTAGLVDKYNWINQRYKALGDLPQDRKVQLMRAEAEQETASKTSLSFQRFLGKGSYSNVYQVRMNDGRMGAAKLSVPSSYRCNVKEARNLAELQSVPELPRIYDPGYHSAPGEFAFVMELLPPNFYEMTLKKRQALPLSLVKVLAARMANFLAAMQGKKAVHGDLKPENFSFDAEGNLKVFDLSLLFKDGKSKRKNLQSPFYRAPEVWARHVPYSAEIDLWSFGCILFEAYTGRPLFPFGEGQEETQKFFCQLHILCGPPPLSFLEDARTPDSIRKLFAVEKQTGAILYAGPKYPLRYRKGLQDAILQKTAQNGEPFEEALLLADFISALLQHQKRMTPASALKHPFLAASASSSSSPLLQSKKSKRRLF